MLATLLGTGCDSPAVGPLQRGTAVTEPPAEALFPRRLLHESELAAKPELRADLLHSAVITKMESGTSGAGDLQGAGVDEIPYLLKESGSMEFRLQTSGVAEAALLSDRGRLFVLKPGQSINVWLSAGEYKLRLTSAGPNEPDIATAYVKRPKGRLLRGRSINALANVASPGVYIDDISAFGSSIVGVDSGYTAMIGAGAGPASVTGLVTALDQLPDSFYGGSDTPLKKAVEAFFANGGSALQVVRVPSAQPADLVAGLGLVGIGPQQLIMPDFPQLSQADADQVLEALAPFTAERYIAAILDLPSGIAQPSQAVNWLQAHPQFQLDRFCFFWPSLAWGGGSMAAGPALAGAFARSDADSGVAQPPVGYANALTDVTGVSVALTDSDIAALNQARINPMAMEGQKVVCLGNDTADPAMPLNERRLLYYVETSIKNALQPFVFAADDADTWATVTAMISSFLQDLWESGGLQGATAADAYTVSCGLGSTMTAQDVLNGYMLIQLTLRLNSGTSTELTFTQQMGS